MAFIVFAACGHPSVAEPVLPQLPAPRLLPPTPIDPKAPGAAYLTSVAMQLQPGWGQFLDDCRLRLPQSHALNRMSLGATAEITVDKTGRVVALELATSGNPDFDRAVREAIADAAPLAAPPQDLLSDDDRLHLRWLFARDRRQAGPATAEIVTVMSPLATVVERWIRSGELTRAAHRIAISDVHAPDREAVTHSLMVAALHEALGSADGAVRRAAVDAIGRTRLSELASDVRALLTVTNDAELRMTAIAAVAALGDREAAQRLLEQLPVDLPEHQRLALAETRALVALGRGADAGAAIRALLDADHPAPPAIALQALSLAPVTDLTSKLATWFRDGDPGTRAAVCAALAGYPAEAAWPWIERGLRDRDATVRATCAVAAPIVHIPATAGSRIRELSRDRDRAVRSRAIAKLVAFEPTRFVHAAEDPAADVRAAYAAALATALPSESDADLRTLIDDRDPDVRAAAWASFAAAPAAPADRAQLAARAARDSAPAVRRAAASAIDDDEVLGRLAISDDSPDVRTVALIQLAGRRGRDAIGGMLLETIASAAPGSAERVRTALAWLLAR
ncbi:MAG: hypothetical protein JWO36_7066 [Myxococcales bacterium]|nr:hypothetical protein [Myxococcales bacterium]